MIGKIHKRASPGNALRYVAKKKDAYRVAGNMGGRTPEELTREFRLSLLQRPEIKQPVYHISLSLRRNQPSDEQWRKVLSEYVEGMGLADCQWVAYRHNDTNHDHVHIVASRVQVSDGKLVSDSFERYRSQEILRELEEKQPVFEKERSSRKISRRLPGAHEYRYFERTGYESGKMELQREIAEAGEVSRTFGQFQNELKKRGITAGLKQTRTGKIQGISYAYEVPSGGEWKKIAVAGNQLGKAYTWAGIEREFGIDRTGEEAIKKAVENYNLQHYGSTERQRERRSRKRERGQHLKHRYDEIKRNLERELGETRAKDFNQLSRENLEKIFVAYALERGVKPKEIAEVIDYSSHRLRGLSGDGYGEALSEFDKVLEQVLGDMEKERQLEHRKPEIEL